MLRLVNNIMDEFKRKAIDHNYDPWDEFQGKDRHKQWGRRAARRSSKQIGYDIWNEHLAWMNEQLEDEYDLLNPYEEEDRDYYEENTDWFRDMKEQGYDFGYSLE